MATGFAYIGALVRGLQQGHEQARQRKQTNLQAQVNIATQRYQQAAEKRQEMLTRGPYDPNVEEQWQEADQAYQKAWQEMGKFYQTDKTIFQQIFDGVTQAIHKRAQRKVAGGQPTDPRAAMAPPPATMPGAGVTPQGPGSGASFPGAQAQPRVSPEAGRVYQPAPPPAAAPSTPPPSVYRSISPTEQGDIQQASRASELGTAQYGTAMIGYETQAAQRNAQLDVQKAQEEFNKDKDFPKALAKVRSAASVLDPANDKDTAARLEVQLIEQARDLGTITKEEADKRIDELGRSTTWIGRWYRPETPARLSTFEQQIAMQIPGADLNDTRNWSPQIRQQAATIAQKMWDERTRLIKSQVERNARMPAGRAAQNPWHRALTELNAEVVRLQAGRPAMMPGSSPDESLRRATENAQMLDQKAGELISGLAAQGVDVNDQRPGEDNYAYILRKSAQVGLGAPAPAGANPPQPTTSAPAPSSGYQAGQAYQLPQ
jgi:hypothetical protein